MLRMSKGGSSGAEDRTVKRRISEAAARAIAEAKARRRAADAAPQPPREIDGRGGKEPARYGDWETKGLATDF